MNGTRIRIGIDVGGTFTDLLALDEATGTLTKIKVPTTPLAPEGGVIAALGRFLDEHPEAKISLLSHSSTIATNALLGQLNLELPRVLLLTTAGFRDVLEIGRQNRSEVYNLFVQRPTPLVHRSDRIGIIERLAADGSVVTALDDDSVARALDAVAASGAASVAVSFLHAYANGDHERRVGAALAARFPVLDVTLSSELDPEYREYERTSTTVVNAALIPLVKTYLQRLARAIAELGVRAPLYVMQSSGGMATVELAALRPATIVESGPAAGVIGAAFLGKALGVHDVLSFDMGGTTAKAGTVFGGEPAVVGEFEAAGRTHSGRAVKGSGYPVRFPFVDLAEVSAGGGTIAWIDTGGALRVGPLSAGADPGPAAYGKGEAPTVTDANIVLGRLNPRALLGGAMPIDAERSRAAIDALLPALPGFDRDRAAAGIVQLVDDEMAKILRIVSIERGHDPRTFTMMAFGGGGPLHACALADALDVTHVIVPPDPGLFSAFGLLAADVQATFVQSLVVDAARVEPAELEAAFASLHERGLHDLAAQNVAPSDMAFAREFELRYVGQGYELAVPAAATIDAPSIRAAVDAFHGRHERAYGYASREDDVEVVSVRLRAIGRVPKPRIPNRAAIGEREPTAAALIETRDVFFTAWRRATPVYERARLQPGDRISGPAVIEQYDSSTLVPPDWSAHADGGGNLRLDRIPRTTAAGSEST